jgi:hypothetical protein
MVGIFHFLLKRNFEERSALMNEHDVIFLHDNDRAHVTNLTQAKLEQLG